MAMVQLLRVALGRLLAGGATPRAVVMRALAGVVAADVARAPTMPPATAAMLP